MTSVVIGTGGMGREAAVWLRDAWSDIEEDPLLGFIDDDPSTHGGFIDGVPVLGAVSWLEGRPGVDAVLGIGSCAARAALSDRISGMRARLRTVVHPTAVIGPGVVLGQGAIVGPGAILTRDVTIGTGCIVNYGAAVGHDCSLGDFSLVAPGAHLAGNVTVGARSWIGIGASVIQGLQIGCDATVAAGAAVIRDVAAGTTVVGVPARAMTHRP